MMEKGKMERGVVELVDTENLVPQEHLLRKVDRAVDFRKLYEIVEPLYSEEEGRPSIDPVVLFKIVLLQHLDGIPSLRGTLRRAQTDIAYRWFLGYTLNEELPHFSTVSYNFRHRFTEETIERVFQWVLNEAGTAGALSPAAVFIDGTHIKASANLNKKIKQEVPAAAKRYRDELLAEIDADREAHGKKPFDDDDDPPRPTKKKRDNTSKKKLARRKKAGFKTVTKSTTDPDCGMFVKGKHERQFAYEAHTACDKNGYVLETVVTPGNVHDSVAFDDVYDKVTQTFPEIETIVADSAYKTPHICKKVFTDGRVLSTACKRPMTRKGGHLCTRSKNCVKTVLRHVWKDYEELADDARYTPEYKELYAKRKETIERVFADAKEKHGMRYTLYRGLARVSKWVRLKFAVMNLNKLARWKAKRLSPLSFLLFSALMYLLCFAACPGISLAGRFSTGWNPDTLFEYLGSSTDSGASHLGRPFLRCWCGYSFSERSRCSTTSPTALMARPAAFWADCFFFRGIIIMPRAAAPTAMVAPAMGSTDFLSILIWNPSFAVLACPFFSERAGWIYGNYFKTRDTGQWSLPCMSGWMAASATRAPSRSDTMK